MPVAAVDLFCGVGGLTHGLELAGVPVVVGVDVENSCKEETIFGNVFFETIATAAVQGEKALAEGVDIMVERGNTIYAIAVESGASVFNADSRKKQE